MPDTLGQRLLACTACHGPEGRATNAGYFPRIAGKPAGYLYNQLLNFREGRRRYAAMSYLLEHLSDDYLHEIAGHFAGQELPYPPPQPVDATPAELALGETLVRRGDAARGVPACTACHGEAMTGRQPAIPGVVGLSRDYLNGQLGAWRAGQRQAQAPDCMAEVVRRLRAEDIAAITAWLARQPVPADAKAAAPVASLPIACGGQQR